MLGFPPCSKPGCTSKLRASQAHRAKDLLPMAVVSPMLSACGSSIKFQVYRARDILQPQRA
jgi:hypothetical protein